MAEKEKVTTMVLDVDLQCSKCHKKVKKLLCKFPQIRDQTYDEKANKVTIKVMCCSPEKIRDKLCCKGGGSIKRIEIKEPKPDQPSGEKPKVETKPDPEKNKGAADSKKAEGDGGKQPITIEVDVEVDVLLEGKPVKPPQRFCCGECYGGRPGGPCWCGVLVPCDGYYYGRPVCSCWGACRCGFAYYCTEEIQQGCTIM